MITQTWKLLHIFRTFPRVEEINHRKHLSSMLEKSNSHNNLTIDFQFFVIDNCSQVVDIVVKAKAVSAGQGFGQQFSGTLKIRYSSF
jgi:hypothetical protein